MEKVRKEQHMFKHNITLKEIPLNRDIDSLTYSNISGDRCFEIIGDDVVTLGHVFIIENTETLNGIPCKTFIKWLELLTIYRGKGLLRQIMESLSNKFGTLHFEVAQDMKDKCNKIGAESLGPDVFAELEIFRYRNNTISGHREEDMKSRTEEVIKGYKIFYENFTCFGGFQYEVGKTYTMEEDPVCCKRGFHFCTDIKECFSSYKFDSRYKVAEVEAFGKIDKKGEKYCTNGIKIIRELSWDEILNMVNTGKDCTGYGNSGNRNSGNRNSGYENSGDCNSGNLNSGDLNSGICNSGHLNSGNGNSGNCNSGYGNSGHGNSGNLNSGDLNSGNCNSGNCNSGHRNSGNFNSGHRNSGDRNSGNRNIGNWNTGDWNFCNHSSGCFNTEQSTIKMFNKSSEMTMEDWWNCDARNLLNYIPKNVVEWIFPDNMTEQEKQEHSEYETLGGYLKILDESDSATLWWNGLPESDKDRIKLLPNFEFEIFCKCVGIKHE